ncbi:MAG: hypothetical protein RIQ33_162 [Bacteroidota bacterium]|jgi:hypothetical protein
MQLLTNIEGWLKNKSLIYFLGYILISNIAIYAITEIKITQGIRYIQCRKGTTGLAYDKAHQFVYFFYYTNYFPLTTNHHPLQYSKQAAVNEITNHGNELMNEYKYWARLGENGRIFTFLPNAILANSAQKPSVKLFNALFFVIALMILYIGFYKINQPLLGFIIVLLINYCPYFIFEIYCNKNIFGLLGSTFFIILGLNLTTLYGIEKRLKKQILFALISSIIIGFNVEIRNEISIVLASLLLIILFSIELNLLRKTLLITIILVSFFATKNSIEFYFTKKINESYQLVKTKKGHLYTGPYISGHQFWHPMVCGLGDFDTKYGFKWDDRVAYNYAMPILQKKYKLPLHYSNKFVLDDCYDNEKFYHKKFDEIPEYEETMKEKILSTVKSDPLWYFEILLKRILSTLSITLPFPFIGWLIFPVAYYLYRRSKWDYCKLIIISLPLSFTPIIIFSGAYTTYNGVFGFILISLIIIELYQRKKNPEPI